MEIRAEKKKLALILYVNGKLDAKSFKVFKDKVGFHVEEEDSTYLILDLEDVEYIDSSGLGATAVVLSSLEEKNRKLKIAGASKFVSHVFKVTYFFDIVPIYPDIESALADIKND